MQFIGDPENERKVLQLYDGPPSGHLPEILQPMMAKNMLNEKQLDILRDKYPWPDERPDFDPINWSLDGGGRWLVTEKIQRKECAVVLEIGSFLGGSVKSWLNASPDVVVVAIDPWPETLDLSDYAQKNNKGPKAISQLGRHDGFYQTFLANLWDHRDRVIPVREYSPAIHHELASIGLQPDLIYLDSDKVGTEIEICHDLFPSAVMTGDDWCWSDESGNFPIREPVQNYCDEHGLHLKVENATWLIDRDPPSLAFRWRCFRRAIRQRRKERRSENLKKVA